MASHTSLFMHSKDNERTGYFFLTHPVDIIHKINAETQLSRSFRLSYLRYNNLPIKYFGGLTFESGIG